ncbi:RrF2 family transcriptional regulator [Aeromicrobium chenweiae]|uniref:Transcriptional regulator n=1 Tax=Aeromicrobium chenweiae TaxID=2079793 RepID=A0A2S0WMR9_9ACTN|nr:Rrf2 family transcriptional regulator [Aeromicrobium chenweiae]AWB92592.1 transcriptional regulator [Aeromicrobium chenweiae]TGN33579.1 Rrf2 family transcriptional regulator [Aeromicrobium chenweiae]
MIDLRFPTTLFAMMLIADAAEAGRATVSSTELATKLDNNPSFVRSLVAPLVRDGLLTSVRGRSGGLGLARPASDITLREIYRAAVADKRIWDQRDEMPHVDDVTTNACRYFESLTDEIEDTVVATLGSKTLSDSLADLKSLPPVAA